MCSIVFILFQSAWFSSIGFSLKYLLLIFSSIYPFDLLIKVQGFCRIWCHIGNVVNKMFGYSIGYLIQIISQEKQYLRILLSIYVILLIYNDKVLMKSIFPVVISVLYPSVVYTLGVSKQFVLKNPVQKVDKVNMFYIFLQLFSNK